MDRPLVASSAEAEEELEWQVASRRRKAWAKCRGSWQASETEDLSTEATTQDEDEDDEEDLPGTQLPAAAGRGRCAPRARAAAAAGGPGRGRAGWRPGAVSCAPGASGKWWDGPPGLERPRGASRALPTLKHARSGGREGVSGVNRDRAVPSGFSSAGP